MNNTQALPPLDLNQRYTVLEASAYLRQSRSQTFKQIKNGTLAVIRVGGRTYIPGEEIAARSRL